MDKVKEFLEQLKTNPAAQEIIKGRGIPQNDAEVIDSYLKIADALGFRLTRDELDQGIREMVQDQQNRTAKVGDAVEKAPLTEDALEAVSGGGDEVIGDHYDCDTTYESNEWCWFSDGCSVIIYYYPDYHNKGCQDNQANFVQQDDNPLKIYTNEDSFSNPDDIEMK